MPRLGVHSLAFTPLWDPAEAGRLLPPILEHGVGAIETPLLDPENYDAAGTRAVAEHHDISIVCSLGLPSKLEVGRDLEQVAHYLDRALEVARLAGSDCLSGVTYGTIGKTSGYPPTEAELDGICRLLDQVSKSAKRFNMRLGIEPCNRYETHLLNTAAQSASMIDRVGADNIFIHLDTYHMNIEENGFREGFADAGDHLGYLHISESNRGVPGRGMIDWRDVFEGAAAAGYGGIMTMESFVHLVPEIASGLAVWRPVAENPEDVITEGLPYLVEEAAAAGIRFER